MRYSEHHLGILGKRSIIGVVLMAVLLASFIMMVGCNRFSYDSSEQKIGEIKQAIDAGDLGMAKDLIESARMSASPEDEYRLNYNEAIINILDGKCDVALELLKRDMENLDEGGIEGVAQSGERAEVVLDAHDTLHAQFHLAYAVAEMCPNMTERVTDISVLEDALRHLYIAFSHGLDVRNQIQSVIAQMIPPCSSFIPAEQKAAFSLENAIPIQGNLDVDLIVCNEGVWIKFDARAHEILRAAIHLSALERKLWPDDSSKLPFSQLHAELFVAQENSTVLEKMVNTDVIPLPEVPPNEQDYQSMLFNLTDFVPDESGTYYLHLYTINNGEAHVLINFRRRVDCDYIDDLVTYTKDFKQQLVSVKAGESLEALMLCPERPDEFEFDLEPGQKAFASLFINLGENQGDVRPDFDVQIRDEKKRVLKRYQSDADDTHNAEFIVFKNRPDISLKMLNTGYSSYIYVQNTTSEAHHYRMTLSNEASQLAFSYHFTMAFSDDCSETEKTQVVSVSFAEIEKTRVAFEPARWICPGHKVVYQPMLASESTILRSVTTMDFFSHQLVRPDDVVFESMLRIPNENKAFPVETAMKSVGNWEPSALMSSGMIQKPITSSTILSESLHPEISGFSQLTVVLSDDEQNENDENSDDSDEEKQEDKKDQRDKVNKQDAPNKSPDKPSESPTSARGAGDDTQGDESRPDENASGNKASAYDPNQYEKSHIDALLDTVEKGGYYVPMPGNLNEQASDKDW